MDATAAAAAPGRVDDAPTDPLREQLVQAVGREYEIVRLLGRGGMGAVYLARDRALERLVAIKVLPPGVVGERDLIERFRREARTVANLQHGGIVPLYASGEQRGLFWFVMGYVRGESLASRLEREGALPADTVRTLLAQVADALDHAHKQGVVHRDIKPDNILLDDTTGRALLTDFGIARADNMLVATSLTQVGSVMGTPHYMSPEQAAAEPVIDGRSDLYSLGVVGYEMLSGRLPFEGKSFRELLIQHVSAKPVPLGEVASGVPEDLAAAVMRCLDKNPDARFADGSSLRAAVGGQAIDDESLAYELSDLRCSAGNLLVLFAISWIFTAIALINGGMLFFLPWWFHLSGPSVFIVQYGAHIREARQRGFSWANIRHVVTQPPRWWFLWWPLRWRRSADVWTRLPSTLKTARLLVVWCMVLLLVELPLLALLQRVVSNNPADRAPGLHALYAIRPVAQLGPLAALVGLIAFLLLLIISYVFVYVLAFRACRPFGLRRMDVQRATMKPTDAAFWRDPRIRPLLVGAMPSGSKRPTTPQEFVTQILATSRATGPTTATRELDVPAAARRLLEAILAAEKEQGTLDKVAPREQLDRLEADLVLMESEGAEPEALALLTAQRESLLRSRERIGRLGERRADAMARLETLWTDTQRLSSMTAGDGASALAAQVKECVAQVATDYPERTRAGTLRSSAAAVLLCLCAVGSLSAQTTARATAQAMYERGQADSALAVLAASGDDSAERWMLEGRVQLARVGAASPFARISMTRAARMAFEQAVAREPAHVPALEQLVWIYRLSPWFIGGSDQKSAGALAALARHAPYRAELLRGYMERFDGKSNAAAARFEALAKNSPDSAGAWFAIADLAMKGERFDEALAAYRRYAQLQPGDLAAQYHLGMPGALHGVGLAEGEAALRRYLAGHPRGDQPRLDVAWWRLGQLHEKQGRIADARKAFEEALRISPGDRDFKASLAELVRAHESVIQAGR
jgi:tetratricopeptide (TPR) repeat protein